MYGVDNEVEAVGSEDTDFGFIALRSEVRQRLLKMESMLSEVLCKVGTAESRGRTEDDEEDRPRKVPRLFAVEALRKFFGQDSAKFKSREQEMGVELGLSGKQDGLVIIGTGGGKSLCFMVPACTLEEKIIVVIVPYKALMSDLLRRCLEAGVQAAVWRDRDSAGTRIVFASIEHIGSAQYNSYIREKNSLGSLHGIFIDEAHAVVSSRDFRQAMGQVAENIRPEGVKVPVIALTATAPLSLENEIASGCGLRGWRTVRGMTSRGNIKYSVKSAEKQNLRLQIGYEVTRFMGMVREDEICHVIVYVESRSACEKQAKALGVLFEENCCCFSYHAGMGEKDREESQRKWEKVSTEKKTHIMVATSAFGCGIDVGTVRGVLHLGRPRTLLDYIQESGRAGRDGEKAEAVVLDYEGVSQGEEKFGIMKNFTNASVGCRRLALDRFSDGVGNGKNCLESGMVMCDLCEVKRVRGEERVLRKKLFPEERRISSNKDSTPTTPIREHTGQGAIVEGNGAVPTPSRSSRKSVSATASELGQLGLKMSRLCPVCSIGKKREVMHAVTHAQSDPNRACFRRRCLKCGMKGHDVKSCRNITNENDGTCFQCSIGLYQNECVHGEGKYGTKACPMKKVLCFAFLAWECPDIREKMKGEIPELGEVDSILSLSVWLRGRSGQKTFDNRNVLGLSIAAPWIYENVLKGEVE